MVLKFELLFKLANLDFFHRCFPYGAVLFRTFSEDLVVR